MKLNMGLKTFKSQQHNEYVLDIPRVYGTDLWMFRFDRQSDACHVSIRYGDQLVPEGHVPAIFEIRAKMFDALLASREVHYRIEMRLGNGARMNVITNHIDSCYGTSVVFTFEVNGTQVTIPVNKDFFR